MNSLQYEQDDAPEWAFTRTLLDFRRQGDSPALRKRLDDLQRRHPFVVPLLTGRVQAPPDPPSSFSPGSTEEAIICVQRIADGWQSTPGALEWLQSAVPRVPKAPRPSKHSRKKKRKR